MPPRPPAGCSARTIVCAATSSGNSTSCMNSAQISGGLPPGSLRTDLLPKVGNPLLDQDTMAQPFGQGLLQGLRQPLRQGRLMAAGTECTNPILLVSDALPTLIDITIGLDQMAALGIELLGPFGEGNVHGDPQASRLRTGGSSDFSTTRRILSAYSRYSAARAWYISATAGRPLRRPSAAMRCTSSARSSMMRSATRSASSTCPSCSFARTSAAKAWPTWHRKRIGCDSFISDRTPPQAGQVSATGSAIETRLSLPIRS